MTCSDVSEEYQQKQQEYGEEHEREDVEILAAIDDSGTQIQESKTDKQQNPGNNSCCPEFEDLGFYFGNDGGYSFPEVLQNGSVKPFSPVVFVGAIQEYSCYCEQAGKVHFSVFLLSYSLRLYQCSLSFN